MSDQLKVVLFLVGLFVLQNWILPMLGVRT